MMRMGDYQEVTIKLSDGYETYARYWPAPTGETAPAVLHFHGIQSHCGWYTETGRAINAAGFAVLQPDRRGSGHNRQARGHAESAQLLIDDGLLAARELMARSGNDRVHIIGVSWGGKLTASLHTVHPDIAASLTLVVPGIFPIIDVSNAEKFRIGWSMVANPDKLYDIPLNDGALFTDNPERIRYVNEDELTLRQATAGFFLASRRMDKIWRKLPDAPAVPLHVTLAGDERIIDNEKTREFIREMTWPKREVTFYEKARHTIEFGADREQFIQDLIKFIREAHKSEPRQ
ncbi:MAG: alpha/beta fold hydrolase [Phycisphaerales bacterium]|nr:alpha/beta fold hydrolase [Phycisphaerales bacterium]